MDSSPIHAPNDSNGIPVRDVFRKISNVFIKQSTVIINKIADTKLYTKIELFQQPLGTFLPVGCFYDQQMAYRSHFLAGRLITLGWLSIMLIR